MPRQRAAEHYRAGGASRARGAAFDREQAIIDTAKELGDSGADLYKVEMPLFGKGTQQELLTASHEAEQIIAMPWVILSSGVDDKLFRVP